MMNDNAAIENDGTKNTDDPFDWNYYTFYRIPVTINDKIISNDGMSNVPSREIGRVFAEYKDNLVVIDGENKKNQNI